MGSSSHPGSSTYDQLRANPLGKQLSMVQVFGVLLLAWRFEAPGSCHGLAQTWPLRSLREWTSGWKMDVSLHPTPCNSSKFEINQIKVSSFQKGKKILPFYSSYFIYVSTDSPNTTLNCFHFKNIYFLKKIKSREAPVCPFTSPYPHLPAHSQYAWKATADGPSYLTPPVRVAGFQTLASPSLLSRHTSRELDQKWGIWYLDLLSCGRPAQQVVVLLATLQHLP